MSLSPYRRLVVFLRKKFGGKGRRSDPLKGRLDRLERRFEGLEERVGALDGRGSTLDGSASPGVITPAECEAIKALCTYWFDRIDHRFDRIDARFDRIDAMFDRTAAPRNRVRELVREARRRGLKG